MKATCSPINFGKVTDRYSFTFALLSTQDSFLHWSKRMGWRSASGQDTMPPTSSSDGLDVPSQRSQTFTETSMHKYVFSTRYLFMYASGFYVHFFHFFFFYCEHLQHGTKYCSLSTLSSFNKQLPCFNTSQTNIGLICVKGAFCWKPFSSPPLTYLYYVRFKYSGFLQQLNSSSVSQYHLLIAIKLWWK